MHKSMLTSDGATIRYVDEGAGEVLILLHGWAQSAAMFRHQIAEFAGIRRVIAPDFRGHGTSPDCAHGHRIYRFAADLAELIEREDIRRATVLGWSMGASVLWAYVDLFGSGRIDRCVFVDEPASVMRQAGMTDDEAADAGALFDAATMIGIASQLAGPDSAAAREAFLDGMITPGIPSELRRFLLDENLRPEARTIAALFADHCSIDWRDVFARFDMPVLVIGGRVSHVDIRSQIWIRDRLPEAELVILDEADGGAHFPFIEAPEVFNAVLAGFLGTPTAAAGAA
ncbi:alpha/beta fold hydrolase [Tistrella mobilis]|uniref:AB hydrolase superfamily protein ydjP n=1 Tax=Tistrella mobilis (strain KA081020-065) TaxID=1110502 RepID=I3TKJ4_TISMK|nr:alpha/beta hydrolase [Tistrella mobilis]AFK53282.1 AB hydrolase superfamily protein ydjP [Tistrella mobilis KA081020-065]